MLQKDQLIYQIVIWILFRLDLFQTAIYLKGSTKFEPCTMQTDSTNSQIVDIYCDTEASLLFGNELPLLKAESYLVRSLIIKGNSNLKRCRNQTYQDINNVENVNYLKILIIEDSQLTDFETGCLDNLDNLEILHLRNQYRADSPNMVQLDQQRLFFSELKRLTSLQELYLENLNLSIGLPKLGFDGWAKNLKILRLSNNQLSFIHNDAFKQTSLTEPWGLSDLYLEQQPEGWKLLRSSNQWASQLHGLRKLSLAGTNLNDPYLNYVRLDLGNYVNHHLVSLNLENCGLLDLIDENLTGYRKLSKGLNLIHIGEQLEELLIGQNRFEHFKTEDLGQQPSDFLIGLKKFTRLRILGLDHNQLPFHSLPEWFGSRKRVLPRLEELRLAGSGLDKLERQSLPLSIRTLDLSENPLRMIDPEWADDLDQLDRLYLNYIRLISVQIEGNEADWSKVFANSLGNTLEHLSFIGCQLRSTLLEPVEDNGGNQTQSQTDDPSSGPIRPNLGLDKVYKLKTLILTENYLTYIPEKAFEYLNQLETLVLSNNHLVSVEEYNENFDRAKQTQLGHKLRLKRLDLSHNQLTTLDRCAYALGFSRPLEDLLPQRPTWLENEMVPSNPVDLDWTGGIQKKQHAWFGGLNLMHNPWICDCRLAWLRHFIDEMTDRIRNAQASHQLPKSYLAYLAEALNFTCQGENKWTGMTFLSLQINDLYLVNHSSCLERPDIYGSDASNMTLLKPCSSLNRSFTSRLMIASSKSFAFSPRKLYVLLEDLAKEEVSKEAGIMIVTAGAAALCFMIISIAIIVWLCIRLKKQEKKGGSRSSREQSNGSRTNTTFGGRLCSCCIRNEKRSSELSVQSRNNQGNGSYNMSTERTREPIVSSTNQGHTESGYYELSDHEDAITTNTTRSSLARRIRKRNRELRDSVNPERMRLVDSGQSRTNLSSSNQNLRQVRLRQSPGVVQKIAQRRNNSESNQPTQLGSTQTLNHEWNGNRPPKPSTPLPPLPLPRKTKSTADLQDSEPGNVNGQSTKIAPTHYSIGAMITEQTGIPSGINKSPLVTTTIRDPKKGVNMNILANEISYQMNKVRETGKPEPAKDRKGYYIMLPWRNESAEPDKRSKPIKPTINRPKICSECGPKCSAKSNSWFNTSKQRLQDGFKWIKQRQSKVAVRATHGRAGPNQPRPPLTRNASLKGPELPKPYFLIRKQRNEGKSPHDYLPMSAEEQQLHQKEQQQQQQPSVVDTTNSTTTTFPSEEPINYVDDPSPDEDEYVTDLAQATTDRNSYIQRHVKLQRKPSNSNKTETTKPVRPPRHHRLQLSNDTYGLNLINNPEISPNSPRRRLEKRIDYELPPPPPPPPYLLDHMKQDNDHLTKMTTMIRNPVPLVSNKLSGDNFKNEPAEYVVAQHPPPILPKPRNLVVIRKEPSKQDQDQHSDLEHNITTR